MKRCIQHFLNVMIFITMYSVAMDQHCLDDHQSEIPYEISPKLKKKHALKKSGDSWWNNRRHSNEKLPDKVTTALALSKGVDRMETKEALEEFINGKFEDSQ